jgi:8-oxo-dGTP diphosphatase
VRGEFPAAPVVGVGAVVLKENQVVIVKRRFPPREGEWSLPGGRVHLGEPLADALRRELREETGLEVAIGPIVEVFERIHRDADRVRYHFVVVDYLCTCQGGELCAGDDVEDARWVLPQQLEEYGVNEFAREVVRKALTIAANGEARSIAWT